MSEIDRCKRAAAERAATLVDDGMTLGLGSGSTMRFVLEALGRRVRDEGLRVVGVPTSLETARLASRLGVETTDFDHVHRLDLAIDGADEVDPSFAMIKGGGGALVREKITASAADRVLIVVDHRKQVATLGRFPLPVAVVPFGLGRFLERMRARGVPASVRSTNDGPFTTDDGLRIVDCRFEAIPHPASLHAELVAEPTVVETGLFIGLCHTLVVGDDDGVRVLDGPAG